MFVDSLMVDV